MAEYQQKNFVPAIENFQNVAKFNELRQTQESNGTISKFRPNYPLFRDSVLLPSVTHPDSPMFKQRFGLFDKHSLDLTSWFYLTQSFHYNNRPGAALKALEKTFQLLP